MNKRMILICFSFLAALIFTGCVTTLKSYKPKTPDEVSIKELLVKWESTWNTHDVNGHLVLWNDKAKIMYGKNRKIATKDEYFQILPNRMKAHPIINLGAPKITVFGHKADVTVNMTIGSYQSSVTFHLAMENGNWSIISWEY